jgi:PEP-CTERM/exosortase A-associated glycosyltransferase
VTLRILHLLDHSTPLHSGYTFRTLAILREQRRLGWKTFHLTTPKQLGCSVAEEECDGLQFYRTLPSSTGRDLPLVGEVVQMYRVKARLGEIVRTVRPDIIHAHSPVLNALPALSVGRKLGIPVVYEVRAFWEDAAVDHGTTREGSARYRMTRMLETHALRRADHVTTICDGLRDDIVARGIPASRVTVIPNAVDFANFAATGSRDESLKEKLGLAGCTVIGFIGSFYAYEGLDLLLDALPRLVSRIPTARLLLVGGGPEEARLREQAAHSGFGDRVVFTGRVPHEDVQRYYDLVDVLAYPRRSIRLTELVTPLKPLEAMAQGRALVASDVGGHRELISDGRTGILFRAGSADALVDSILRLLENTERSTAIRAAGRAFVERERGWASSVARYRDVFARLAPAAVA